MIVAVYENKLCEVLGKYTFIVIIVVLIAMSMGTISSCLTFIPYNVAQFIFPNLMPLLILFMIYAYGAITNKVIRYLGVISLEIYLVQGFVMTAVGTFKFSWLAFALLVLLLVIPLSAIVHKFGNIISSNSINK
jgi:peptidoglycan/LPS O-acetylase OafA/YrhL